MKNFKNILVMAENTDTAQVLLSKAMKLAKSAKANLTIIANKQDKEIANYLKVIHHQLTNGSLPSARDDWAIPAVDIDIKYYSAPFSHQQILAEIDNHHYDLLIRDINASQLHWGFSWSDNQYLLREEHTNLLLVGEKEWPDNGHILAAIETEESTEKHQQLNQFMLDESQYIAKLLKSDVHLINCYQERLSISFSEPLLAEDLTDPYHQHCRHLEDSALNLGLPLDSVHVEAGLPEYVIPHEAHRYQADIVVLGAGEHHGLLDMIKGHSCEYIIDKLSCDALILKADKSNIHSY